MICKSCNQDLPRFRDIRRVKKGFYYVCNLGKRWHGHTCPECNKAYRYGENRINPVTERLCRECKKPLPASRYFTHIECNSSVEYLDLSEQYGVSLLGGYGG